MGVDFMSVSVNATVIGAEPPEPDPDREHCVRISFYGSHQYENAGESISTSHRGFMLVYSQFPIYMDETDDGYMYINTFKPSTNRTRVETELNISVNGTIYGQHDFQYHFLDIERMMVGTMWIDYRVDTGQVAYHGCDPLNEHPIVSSDLEHSLTFYSFVDYTSESSQYYEYSFREPAYETLWYAGGNSRTLKYPVGNINTEDWRGVTRCSYTVYNFNNPIFASGDAWLAYCKEQV